MYLFAELGAFFLAQLDERVDVIRLVYAIHGACSQPVQFLAELEEAFLIIERPAYALCMVWEGSLELIFDISNCCHIVLRDQTYLLLFDGVRDVYFSNGDVRRRRFFLRRDGFNTFCRANFLRRVLFLG